MRVLQLTSDYPPMPLWGMGWHVYFLSESLRELDHQVAIGTAHKSALLHENIITTSMADDARLLSSDPHQIFDDYDRFNIWQELLAREVISSLSPIDIIHCHNWMSWITTRILMQHWKSSKVVFTFHLLQKQYDEMLENPIPSYHNDIIRIETDAIQQADRVIVHSEAQLNLLLSAYEPIPRTKIRLIPCGVGFVVPSYQQLESVRLRNPFLDIVFVGRIERDKGIEETLEAFTKLISNMPNERLRLHVVGNGPLLTRLSRRYSSRSVVFHGFVERNELRTLLIQSSIFCMPSTSEGMANTVVEALTFGVVPIFTEGKSVPHLFENMVHGLKVKLYKHRGAYTPDVEEIYECMALLVRDSQVRNTLSANAYQYSNNLYTLAAMGRKTEAAYYELLRVSI